MAGLDPAILLDARIKSSHDELKREDEEKTSIFCRFSAV
jgi:hypothetical protein